MRSDHKQDETPDFWDWSLSVYRRRGVADALLELQDSFGLNVNLLLWCIWAGKYYSELEDETVLRILRDTAEWQQTVITPLRQIRRDMKSLPPTLPAREQENLRRRVKTLELEAERMEQVYLAGLTRQFAGPHRHARGANAWHHNLLLYHQSASRLEFDDRLGVDEDREGIRALYLRILKLIFPEEVVYL